MKRPESVTKARVDELLRYDPESGKLYWKAKLGAAREGDEAGTYNCKQYVRVNIDGRRYMAHRLVWLIHHGELPPQFIDHINGVMDDNRIENLRCVSNSVNRQNMKRAHRSNKTGVLGVCFNRSKKRYVAQINVNGERRNLGTYSTAEEAHAVYLEEKRKHHVGCTI